MKNSENTTVQVFDLLVSRPDLWRKTGRPMQQRLRLRDKIKNGINISLETKEKILAEAGFTVKQEKIWELPIS